MAHGNIQFDVDQTPSLDNELQLQLLKIPNMHPFAVPYVINLIQKAREKAEIDARIQSLQWALNDYNMPDTDTAKNLAEFIADLELKKANGEKSL